MFLSLLGRGKYRSQRRLLSSGNALKPRLVLDYIHFTHVIFSPLDLALEVAALAHSSRGIGVSPYDVRLAYATFLLAREDVGAFFEHLDLVEEDER